MITNTPSVRPHPLRARPRLPGPRCLLMAGIVQLGIAQGAAAQYPTDPPAAAPLRALQLPPFEEFTLPNGIEVVVVENRELPLVTLSITMAGGSRFEPAGKEGLAGLVADVLTRGTAGRTAEEIAAEIEGVGSSLNAGASDDFFTVSTTVLKEYLDLGFDLVSDVLTGATFPDDEVELTRTRLLSAIRAQEAQPGFLASRFFSAALYGPDHPYGRSVTSAGVASITRDDVVAFASRHLVPDGSILILAGDLSASEARTLATRYLGGWTGSPPPGPAMDVPAPGATEILLVNRPGSAQSNILVGNLTMRPGDPDYYAAVLANHVLGGGSDGRLFKILREERGWTYGAYSNQNRPVGMGRFQANTEVRTAVTDSALAEMLHQLRRMRTEAVAEEELADAKGYLVGSFPRQIETPQQIAGQVRTVKLLDLGDAYLRTYRERLAGVSADDILEVTGRLVRPDSSVIVVVGDGQAVYERLAAIAPVRLVDVDGRPLTPADLAPTAEAVAFDLSQVASGRDSFEIYVQGTAFGTMTRSFEETVHEGQPALAVVSDLVMGPLGQLSSRIVIATATGRPLAYEQTGAMQGQQSEVRVSYAGGRVTGTVNSPQREATVDTVLGDHVIDDSMLQVLAGALPLEDGGRIALAAYDPAEGTVSQITVAVSDGGTVTVPAGEFDSWKLDVTGSAVPLEYWVTKAEPRQLLRMVIVGQPLSFELAGSTWR